MKRISLKVINRIRRLSLQIQAGLLLVVVGLVVAVSSLTAVWLGQRSAAKPRPINQVLNNTPPQANNQPLISGTPVHISVPSVGISLNVIPGYYYPSTKSWTLTLTNAQYAVYTPKANNKQGDTFIYAHARYHMFADLPKVKPGAQAVITTDNGHTFTYDFDSSIVVPPSNTALFDYKGRPVLILQTCTGVYWQNRQLFVFNFSRVS